MKTIKDIFDKFAGNGRYIKLDGSAYNSGPIRSFFERPEARLGLVALALNTTIYITTGNNAGSEGTNILTKLASDTSLMFAAWMLSHITRTYDFNYVAGPEKAIDRTGTDLSQRQLTTSEYTNLRDSQKTSQKVFMIISIGTGAFAVLTGQVLILGACLSAYHFGRANIASKLLNKEYVFCGKPPAKEVKVTHKSPKGGKLAHNDS